MILSGSYKREPCIQWNIHIVADMDRNSLERHKKQWQRQQEKAGVDKQCVLAKLKSLVTETLYPHTTSDEPHSRDTKQPGRTAVHS